MTDARRHRDPSMRPPLVPLATLIGRELRGDKSEKPTLKCGHHAFAKRGEDYFLIKPDCLRIPGNSSSSFSVFAIFDGHNGVSAAVFAKEHLLDNVMSAIPPGLGREEWLQALPQALVAGFVRTDIDFQRKGETSGTTVTLVVVDGWRVTVASVGDSRCILDTQGGVVSLLTVDHRLEENAEERERVTASGGEVGRLNLSGGQEVGPLRCWPGGLCLSRSIGDTDVGEFIVPIPHVKQVKLSRTGGRLIIASDGIWDALSSEVAAKACRGIPAELAAKLVVKEALRTSGLKDDTTCLVVDIIPPSSDCCVLPSSPKKHQNKFTSLLFGKKSQNTVGKHTNKLSSVGAVEELFEEGSAILEERLGKNFPLKANSSPFRCAICQMDQTPNEGLSATAGTHFSPTSRSSEGPYLCVECRRKKDAMEGKRLSQSTVSRRKEW
ncbi:probable protein phosphatase 2C 33 [Phoenix dactylifera]|uniref:protein-serine/threonine phosphatase n=1 Tax=Phoenix dactylifera TaxID=42345 RepID=A0A8B7CVY9_PHODC|nr:probable protein phosphatase 2C 33 [Phoenix dactylifera]XP_038977942.1 probable protein phosphatase 2C 33 [Phoenix dactylifera]